VTVDEVVHHLYMSYGPAHGVIQDKLGFHKFMQEGFQNNPQEIRTATLGQSAKPMELLS
jgi:hypothetical protein